MSELSAESIAEILERLDRGEAADKILASYPGAGEEVESVLATITGLEALSSRPYVSARQKSQQQFLGQALAMKTAGDRPVTAAFNWSLLFRRLSLSLAMMLVILFAGSLLSRSALPGDLLYGPKRTLEELRMSLTANSDAIDDLRDEYQAERLDEVRNLLRLRRSAEVEFEGTISGITAETLTVSDILINLTGDTRLNGTPDLLALVRVNGYTRDGQLFAGVITVLADSPLPVQVTPAPAPAQTPQVTRQNFEQAPDEDTATPTNSATPTPSRTPSPTPSPTPEPTATASPTDDNHGSDDSSGPGDGDDGSGDDGGGEATDEPKPTDEPDDPTATDEPDDPDATDEPDDHGQTREPGDD